MKSGKNEKGLTLVEVILTLIIFSIAFMAVMSGLNQATLIRGESYERMFATNLARQQLEKLKIYNSTSNDKNATVWSTTTSPVEKGITYEVNTGVITNTSGIFATDATMVPVRATVKWTSRGKTNTVVLETCYGIAVTSATVTTPSPTWSSTPSPTPSPTPKKTSDHGGH